MDDCKSTGIYESLKFCQGKSVLPGIRNHTYYIPTSKIVKWPALPEVEGATDMASLAKYDGNFVLEADAKWQRIDLKLNKGAIESETQGEYPSVTYLNKLAAQHPEVEEAATGFCRQAVADDFVFAVPQRNGKYRILGSEMYNTVTKPAQTTGEGTTGEAGTTLNIEATDVCPSPFYPGTLETVDGDISGETGQLITAEG